MNDNNPKWSFEENNNDLFFNFYAIASSNNLQTRHFEHVQKVWWIHTSCIQVNFSFDNSWLSVQYRRLTNKFIFQSSPRWTIQQKMLGYIQQQCQHQRYLLEFEQYQIEGSPTSYFTLLEFFFETHSLFRMLSLILLWTEIFNDEHDQWAHSPIITSLCTKVSL